MVDKIKKGGESIPDTNKYFIHISAQLKNLGMDESKHIEVDDRFNLFAIKTDKDRYTGWIYWLNGEIPAMTFKNATIKELIADAYEKGTFSAFSEGSLYNASVVSALEASVDSMASDLVKDQPSLDAGIAYADAYDAVANEIEKQEAEVIKRPYFGNDAYNLVEDFNPSQMNVSKDGHCMTLTFYKSAAKKLVKLYPIFTEEQAEAIIKARYEYHLNKLDK